MGRSSLPTTNLSWIADLRNGGSHDAWQKMEEVYRPVICRFAESRKIPPADSEDIAQQCLLDVHRHIGLYSPERGRFRDWLLAIARNRISDWFRKHREQEGKTRDFERPDAKAESPDKAFERMWLGEHLRFCLELVKSEFNARDLRAFQYVAFDQMPAASAAATLNTTVSVVHTAKSRIVKRLRQMMTEQFGDDQAGY